MPGRSQAVAERRAAALRMRAEGKSHAEVTAALGYSSEGACRRDLSRALSSIVQEAGRELITIEVARTEQVLAAMFPLMTEGSPKDRAAAAREVTRCLDRRSKLLGLDRTATERARATDAESAKGLLSGFAEAMQRAYADLPQTDA